MIRPPDRATLLAMDMMPLDPEPQAPSRFTAQEALVCAMVLMGISDRAMSDAELGMMSRLVRELPVFNDFNPGEIETVTDSVLGLLETSDGLERASEMIRDALPQRLRETAYLLACEVGAADGDLSQGELRFLQDFRIVLDIDRLVAGAIERAARARFQVI